MQLSTLSLAVTNVIRSAFAMPTTSLAAWYKADTGITTATGVSTWADQSGNRNIAVSPGTAGSYFATPSAVANQITGDITIISYLAMANWQPASTETIIAKDSTVAGGRSYAFNVQATGLPRLNFSTDGTALTSVTSTSPYTYTAGQWAYVAVERTASTGEVRFYTSPDKITWTLLSTVSGAAGAIFASASEVQFGALASTAINLTGSIGDSEIYSGLFISGTGTLKVDFDPWDYVSGSTWVAADTGETWTIYGTASITNRNLLQPTVANQPIYLNHSGTNYAYHPGISASNYATPDSILNRITGDIDIRWGGKIDSVAPSVTYTFVSKWLAPLSYLFRLTTLGNLIVNISSDGTTSLPSYVSTVTIGSVGITANSLVYLRFTRSATTGTCNFYYSNDGITWTSLGSPVAGTAGNIFAGSSLLCIGYSGGVTIFAGRTYRAQIYNGINGTLAVDFNPASYSSGSTWTSATGEVWTINNAASTNLPAQVVTRPSLLFNGTAHYLKTAAFTLNQPTTIYLVGKQITWTASDVLVDGLTANTGAFVQTTATPQLNINAGTSVAANTNLAVNANGVICLVFNGASSSIKVNNTTATTGNAGAGNMGGITLGAAPTPAGYANGQFYEMAVYSVAHDASTQNYIISYLMAKYGI